ARKESVRNINDYMKRNNAILMKIVFFFQAEDGIRDLYVTGVQTCALPISGSAPRPTLELSVVGQSLLHGSHAEFGAAASRHEIRSEERRVGKEGRSRM